MTFRLGARKIVAGPGETVVVPGRPRPQVRQQERRARPRPRRGRPRARHGAAARDDRRARHRGQHEPQGHAEAAAPRAVRPPLRARGPRPVPARAARPRADGAARGDRPQARPRRALRARRAIHVLRAAAAASPPRPGVSSSSPAARRPGTRSQSVMWPSRTQQRRARGRAGAAPAAALARPLRQPEGRDHEAVRRRPRSRSTCAPHGSVRLKTSHLGAGLAAPAAASRSRRCSGSAKYSAAPARRRRAAACRPRRGSRPRRRPPASARGLGRPRLAGRRLRAQRAVALRLVVRRRRRGSRRRRARAAASSEAGERGEDPSHRRTHARPGRMPA